MSTLFKIAVAVSAAIETLILLAVAYLVIQALWSLCAKAIEWVASFFSTAADPYENEFPGISAPREDERWLSL